MHHFRLALFASTLFTSALACSTTLSPEAFRVHEADEKMIRGCSFLGSVEGASSLGGMSQETGMQNAKNRAIEAAADRGATHIVIDSITGGYSPYVSGRAYRC